MDDNTNEFKEFLLSMLNGKNGALINELNNRWEEWKKEKSKEVKKDYEVLKYHAKHLGNMENKIVSIKRLSDGEVFTIGDKNTHGIIENFYIGWAGMEIHYRDGSGQKLCDAEKVKKDYEIECIVKDSRNYWRQKDQLYNSELFGSYVSDKWLLDNGGKIYSIKRLSDSETFSIRSNYKGCPHCNTHYITSFEIINGELIVKREDGTVINFATIIPVKKEPLFITEDNIKIYEGCTQRIYFVYPDFTLDFISQYKGYSFNPNLKYFSTEDAATQYILMNKPLLSVKEICDWYFENNRSLDSEWDYENGLKELAKKKLNQ